MSTKAELEAELEWLLPAVASRSRYGISSCKLLRHCLLDEPLDDWNRPYDHHDLIGVTATANAAPEHHREKALAAIQRFRTWLEPEYVAKADAYMAGAPA